MFDTSIAGSLPKPGWLAETRKLWPQWKLQASAGDGCAPDEVETPEGAELARRRYG
jgi:methionine synthase II (cobalamin-independent)